MSSLLVMAKIYAGGRPFCSVCGNFEYVEKYEFQNDTPY